MVKPSDKMTGCERQRHETRTRRRSESKHKRCRRKHTNGLDNHCDNRRILDEGAREVCGHRLWDSAQYGEYGTVPAEWDCQRSIYRCEFFAMGGRFAQAVLPHKLGVVQFLDRGEVHCTSDKKHIRMSGWRFIRRSEALKTLWCWKKQLEVRRVKITSHGSKQKTNGGHEHVHTAGNEIAYDLANAEQFWTKRAQQK